MGGALRGLALAADSPEEELKLHLQALSCFRQVGDTFSVIHSLMTLGDAYTYLGQPESSRVCNEEAMSAAVDIGDKWSQAVLWSNHCIVLFLLGELEEAAQLARRLLATYRRVWPHKVAQPAIFALACCATSSGDYERAALLTGAHDTLEADYTGDLLCGPFEQQARDNNKVRLRAALGQHEYDRLHQTGTQLTLDQAFDLALDKTPSQLTSEHPVFTSE